MDFVMISSRVTSKGVLEIYPKFIIKTSSDLMIRGGDFYAVWLEDKGLWSTDEQDVIHLIDKELDVYAEECRQKTESHIRVLHMWDAETGIIDTWHRYCQKQMRDHFHMLDEKIIFANSETSKKDYASKKLDYPLEDGDCSSYDKLISTLYSEEERHKIEWAIGSIVTGDSKKIQKFMVLYGAMGTGKSTIMNIIQKLFEGYYSVFDAKALGSSSNSFALEAFKTNPLIAIQHDGDLSRIEDNTRLNSLVSHEMMTVNEKFKSAYSNRFKAFLFMGTNKPVKITDAKSGLIRRLIDVEPSGNKVAQKEYDAIMKRIPFELGAIASHCRDVYLSDSRAYDNYIPVNMLGATNDFYNFVFDNFDQFKENNGVTLKSAWEMYKTYCEDTKVLYPFSQRVFKEELKNYFNDFKERATLEDGTRVRNYFSEFKTDKFDFQTISDKEPEPKSKAHLIEFKQQKSKFDSECADCLAQYATQNETPSKKWENVTSKLSSLDTSKLHYVLFPDNYKLIVIDFDIKDKDGNKSYERNLEEASKWPPTYAELSKSGAGIHLHYIYDGDVNQLSRIYDSEIEIKVFTGNSSLRRRLTKCNDLPIATINSGLPLKGEKQMANFEGIKNERALRTLIKKNLNKEFHPGTKPSIDFINKILEDTYRSGMPYDVSDMKNAVLAFAAFSTHRADYCIKLVSGMKFKSNPDLVETTNSEDESEIVFYDCEVFPNLFLVNWKAQGKGKPIVRMINPKPEEIEELVKYRLIGFNCRRYDNHMLYARLMGYTEEQLYDLSQKIINSKKGTKGIFFGEAYNLSYTDIYDFASAGNKKSLKKLEIEMGIHHQELGLPWDKPVPKERWIEVAEYCDNDVIATEAAFDYLSADWTARQILADLAGMSVNDTTNSLTTKIIFGGERKPQSQFNYRNMALPVSWEESDEYRRKFGDKHPFRIFDANGEPMYEDYPNGPKDKTILPDGWSILPFFPGYTYDHGVSTYRGEEVGEGGYVYAEPGIHWNVALLDIASMHPHSVLAEMLFGPVFTEAFRDIVEGRVNIKHEAWDIVNTMLGGKLAPYVQKVINGEMTSKDLANALKTAINSVYGLTSASFENPFNDPRNVDNIVAKRGALFMVNLKHKVQEMGYTVAHIKTDSIKIPNATPEIIQFVMDYGKEYGYTFEHEATYDRMCLVNDAVYIAMYKDGKHAGKWTATGTQFQVPYVFKTLFSKEPIEFDDMCETKSVATALYIDMNEKLPDGEHSYNFIGKVGQFCPIKPGCGGGELLREGKDKAGNIKYYSATGAKGYLWLESEMVRTLGKEDCIDRTYYNELVDAAVDKISELGSFETFVSPGQPPWCEPCGRESCDGCPDFENSMFDMDCAKGYDIRPLSITQNS